MVQLIMLLVLFCYTECSVMEGHARLVVPVASLSVGKHEMGHACLLSFSV